MINMKNLFLCAIIGLLVVACKTVDQKPVIDPSKHQNVMFCDHKYDDEFDFYYYGRIESTQQQMFGQKVFVFTYTLLDDTKKYLSGDEVSNYRCTPVKPINNNT